MDLKGLTWDEYRRRMLAETARFIEWGLANPDKVARIPIKPVGQGGFPAQVGEWFWATVLSDRRDSFLERWRHWLARRTRGN